jgi:Holliday junction resolvase RusA-like endonuclease
MKLSLPWPSTGNHRLMPVKRGGKIRLISSREAKDDKRAIYFAIAAIHPRPIMPPGRYNVTMYLSPPWNTKRKWDIANREKTLIDALVSTQVIEDDSLIDELHLIRDSYVEGGRVNVLIELR